jgi:hypothetical protein
MNQENEQIHIFEIFDDAMDPDLPDYPSHIPGFPLTHEAYGQRLDEMRKWKQLYKRYAILIIVFVCLLMALLITLALFGQLWVISVILILIFPACLSYPLSFLIILGKIKCVMQKWNAEDKDIGLIWDYRSEYSTLSIFLSFLSPQQCKDEKALINDAVLIDFSG